MTVSISMSAGAKRLLTPSTYSKVMMREVAEQCAEGTLQIIKSPGYCPVDTGNLRSGHSVKKGGISGTVAGVPEADIVSSVWYWKCIVFGCRHGGKKTSGPKSDEGIKSSSRSRKSGGGSKQPAPSIPWNYPKKAVDHMQTTGKYGSIAKMAVIKTIGG